MRCGRRNDLFSVGGANPDPTPDNWRADNTCSYCGSISPAELFKRIEAGEEIVPTDKNYKAYIGSRSKFYFQHLSKEDQIKFLQLYNDRKMKIAGGGFYVLPFFANYIP